jgi:Flp pilus assembly protein TadG
MTGATTKRHKLFGLATTSRRTANPVRLGDHGAVAVEFALIFPAVMLLIGGIFGLGVVMIEDLQLTFVVQGAAKVEAAQAKTGVAWAYSQLGPPASFTAANPTPCGTVPGAQITGTWPISLGIFPSLTLSAQYCWPL